MVQPASRAQVRVGDTTVTFLPDGGGRVSPAAAFPASGDAWATHSAWLDPDGWLPISIGSFLVRTPDRAILVDLGLGVVDFEVPGFASFKAGRLLDALAGEGLGPSDIDTVVFTHLHHDHVGWTSDIAPTPATLGSRTAQGLTFPEARHLVSEAEWTYWQGSSEVIGPDPLAVQAPLADRVEFVADDEEIAPGVRILATPGHTPGHQSVVVSDPREGRRVVILGDVMHCQAQVSESSWSFVFDADAEQAGGTREKLLRELEDERTLLAAGHFAGHVFGRVLPPAIRRAWATDDDITQGS